MLGKSLLPFLGIPPRALLPLVEPAVRFQHIGDLPPGYILLISLTTLLQSDYQLSEVLYHILIMRHVTHEKVKL